MNQDQLIEAITREVMAAFSGSPAASESGVCEDAACQGACAAHCSEKVRAVLANGASRVSFQGDAAEIPRDLHRYIDHTLLKPDATADQIDHLCAEAIEYEFPAVCVNPTWVRRCADKLRGSSVKVAAVIGFPLGATLTEVKAIETRRAIRDGAREIDMVMNIGALKSGDYGAVQRDMAGVTDACRESGVLSKVIIEAALLTDTEKVIASQLAAAAKADFVKTSTGFGPGGATVFDVALMREAVAGKLGVKAAGGVRTAEDVQELLAAGATRVGASAGVAIVSGGSGDGKY